MSFPFSLTLAAAFWDEEKKHFNTQIWVSEKVEFDIHMQTVH